MSKLYEDEKDVDNENCKEDNSIPGISSKSKAIKKEKSVMSHNDFSLGAVANGNNDNLNNDDNNRN